MTAISSAKMHMDKKILMKRLSAVLTLLRQINENKKLAQEVKKRLIKRL